MINQEIEDVKSNKRTEFFLRTVNSIINYYYWARSGNNNMEGDEWKINCGIKNQNPVPEDLDKMILESFKKKIKHYGN